MSTRRTTRATSAAADEVDDIDNDCHQEKGKTKSQQEANKVAQQRYRERKKQKFHELELLVKELEDQLVSADAVKAQNKLLEDMNEVLQRQVVEKEREIERLKRELDERADAVLAAAAAAAAAASGGNGQERTLEGRNSDAKNPTTMTMDGDITTRSASPGSEIQQTGGSGVINTAAVPPSNAACCGTTTTVQSNGAMTMMPILVSCDVLPSDIAGIDFQKGFTDQVDKLKVYLTEKDLLDINPTTTSSIDQSIMVELGQLVGRSCQLCQAAVRAEGVKVLELITPDPDQLPKIGILEEEQAGWGRVLDALHLTTEQQQSLLMLRQSHLSKMKCIYQERQNLNLKGMALLLPQQSNRVFSDTTVEGRMNAMSTASYLPIARSNAELSAVLDSIKDNLRREQRAVMEFNCATTARILNPLQAALYMIHAYPRHCDALALGNVLSKRTMEEEGSRGDGGEEDNIIAGGVAMVRSCC